MSSEEPIYFDSLSMYNWRQFADVQLDLTARLTVLTGANGSGKTTLLNMLCQHWGWNFPCISQPDLSRRELRKYKSGLWQGLTSAGDSESTESGAPKPNRRHRARSIGSIGYSSGSEVDIQVPGEVADTFNVSIAGRKDVRGVFVASHRPVYVHRRVDSIPTQVDARENIFNSYINQIRSRFSFGSKVQSPSYALKQSVISLAMFGYGNDVVDPEEDARRTFEGFQDVLSIVLPSSLGFRGLRVKIPDVVMVTETGDFSIDAVSGGISAIIDMAWQLFLYSTLFETFTVVIDEPETHLHPELQKIILPSFLKAFPKCRFVVATHNPFIISSVRESRVYVLRYRERRVYSEELSTADKSATSNEILTEVLGTDSASAAWVDSAIQGIAREFAGQTFSEELVDRLADRLRSEQLMRYLPTVTRGLLRDQSEDEIRD